VNASVSRRTDTSVFVDSIDAVASNARIRTTLVNLVFTVFSVVTVSAAAFVALGEWLAVSVDTRVRIADLDRRVTVDASEPGVAFTLVAVEFVGTFPSHAGV
jgi:hypothetical protein